jgi:hypothetical protein
LVVSKTFSTSLAQPSLRLAPLYKAQIALEKCNDLAKTLKL